MPPSCRRDLPGNPVFVAIRHGFEGPDTFRDRIPPGEDGLSLCRHIREAYDTPIHLLTALAQGTDRIVGLEIGADDDVLAAEVRIVP